MHSVKHQTAEKSLSAPQKGYGHSAALIAFAAATFANISCSPDRAAVSGGSSDPGPLEGYAIVYQLPAQGSAASPSAPAVASASAPNAAAPAAQRPALQYCFQIAPGATRKKETNEYDCRFFEYYEQGGKKLMSSSVLDNQSAGAGAPAVCSFGPTGPSMNFLCTYNFGFPTAAACSTFNEHLQSNKLPASFANVNASGAIPTIVATQALGSSDKGLPLPLATEVFIIKGSCGIETATALPEKARFLRPNADQIVRAGGTPATGAGAGSGAAGPGTFSLQLRPGTRTNLKTSVDQASTLEEGTTRCELSGTAAVTLTAKSPTGGSSPTVTAKHYMVSGASIATGECKSFLDKVGSSRPIYLFEEHWTLAPSVP